MTPSETKERTGRLELATRALLETPAVWAAVAAVAEALLRRNILTWDEVRPMVDEAMSAYSQPALRHRLQTPVPLRAGDSAAFATAGAKCRG
jgi:hypothetical protein